MTQALTLGEIVTWKSPPHVDYQLLRTALDKCGIGKDIIRDMLPRNAFGRAVKHLKEERVIKQTGETNDMLIFQFTKEHFDKQAAQYTYNFEAKLVLNKNTGYVTCSDSALAAEAMKLIGEEMGRRASNDVTTIIKRVFERNTRNGDLFPIRPQGGAYFVPDNYRHIVDQVQGLFNEIGGQLLRWQIGDSPSNVLAVGNTIFEAVEKMIADYSLAVDNYDPTTNNATQLKDAMEHIQEINVITGAYRAVLGDLANQLQTHMDECSQRLEAKLHKG